MCGDKKGLGPGSWVPVGVECPAKSGGLSAASYYSQNDVCQRVACSRGGRVAGLLVVQASPRVRIDGAQAYGRA